MKKTVTLIVSLLVVGLLLYAGHVGRAYLAAATEFNEDKVVLIEEIRGLMAEAKRDMACDWKLVAHDYLGEYERVLLDGLFAEAVHDPRWNSDLLAAETAGRVRQAVRNQLCEEGDYPVTYKKITARLESDHRIRRLDDLSGAIHVVYLCAHDARDVESKGGLQKVRVDFEGRKVALVRLLKQAS